MWLLLALSVCVSAGVLILLSNTVFGGLDFASDSAAAVKVISLIKERHLGAARFYDLGSAWGSFDIKIARALPHMEVIGIDNDRLRIFFSRIRSPFFTNLKFRTGDIFNADLSSAGIIYIYLPQEIMPRLENKLRGLKSGAIVVTNKVNFPGLRPVQKLDKIFIYQL